MAVEGRIRSLWILHHATIFGGADRFVLKLASHAMDSGISVRMLCEPGSELAARCGPAVEVVGVSYPDFRPPAVMRAPAALGRLRGLLRSVPPDAAVVASGPRPQAYASWTLSRAPLVHLAHEQDTAARLSARLLLPRTGTVVAVGSNSARAYGDALGTPVRAVNNILDTDELDAAARVRDAARGAYDEPPRLGALVRLIPEKGLVELVDELARSPEAWSGLYVGAIPQAPAYARAVDERIAARGLGDRIHLLGPVDDLAAFLNRVDVLVVPSTGREGQPTTILEALAHGRGVVVREPMWSDDYAGLPVHSYRDERDLGTALAGLAGRAASRDELERRFGPGQALGGILDAALSLRPMA